nr:hypothetical protein GCM10025730_03020 [Promicromonospora thailandica]
MAVTHPHLPGATILGYPRIGRRRELKRAVESFWAGRTTLDDLEATARDLRRSTARHLTGLGLDTPGAVPGSFSFYDQVLDVVALLGAVPDRFADLTTDGGRLPLEAYFTVARGEGDRPPLEMTKWFDTNYHYLVPEIGPDTPVGFADDRVVREFTELAHPDDGGRPVVTRPVLVGPVTFLLLSKAADGAPDDFRPLDRLDDVVAAYAELLRALAAAGAPWVQLDEPALVTDLLGVPFDEVADAVRRAYTALATDLSPRPNPPSRHSGPRSWSPRPTATCAPPRATASPCWRAPTSRRSRSTWCAAPSRRAPCPAWRPRRSSPG